MFDDDPDGREPMFGILRIFQISILQNTIHLVSQPFITSFYHEYFKVDQDGREK